ncbi:serine/threonine protein kinase [Defluviimonas sp. WL0075]|uniref:Serine/threonine-protein kinase n=1 Tax=Albidovulum sediminicola TaxID=2984331 RepID=A0ABT2Z011_9RHOB|nr:serine/threonine protein kinase [Defluviimonas sp. WL0075]MCV2864484.1 serine/threonine-protein kinase [Defluviimonas sp. WL0075]
MNESRPGDAFRPGDLLNNTYRIEALLGRGGTSEVYRARSEISGRVVALKALRSEFSGNEDFLLLMTREEEMRDIRHDAVVRYSDNQRTPEGTVYLVMDYVDGPGLDRKLREGGMSAEDLLVIGARVAEGLEAAHSKNIVHRDLSPDNIILRNGNPAEAVIIDFGIAKDTNPGAATIVGNEFAGKYAYAAPEQLSGRTDARSDLYSLGALLLATFRGRPPNAGSNPMEVLQKKGEPLDTEGVPEPLKSLIAKMSHPDPDQRFQSAAEVVAAIRSGGAGAAAPLEDKTVIVARPKAEAPKAAGKTPLAKPSATPAQGKSKLPLIMALLLLLAGGGGAGAYFSGLLGPSLPMADPFTFTASKPKGGVPEATGFAPSQEVQRALAQEIARQSGTAELSLARGDIEPGWGADVGLLLSTVAVLDDWQLSVSDMTFSVSGQTADPGKEESVTALLNTTLPGGMSGSVDITREVLRLPTANVQTIMDQIADCGPLTQEAAPAEGYGEADKVVVSGRLADNGSRIRLYDALREAAGDRDVVIDAEILNPALCLIETRLPSAPSGGFGIKFGFGDSADPNPSGRYFVGENPVIDVKIPAGITDGFLYVSVLDVSGNVFHLLPNQTRTGNAVAALRAGQSGEVPVRVAYGLTEAQGTAKLAFTVDASSLGKSKVMVLYAKAPLFKTMRDISEPAANYAQALADLQSGGTASVASIDSRILTTAQP